ncbi:MAG: SirB2 family protein [Gammaproteobacteria bacterium]
MSLYETIKFIHAVTALLSISGFVLRGFWMMQGSAKLQRRWVNIVPHINDTILLVSAIILVIVSTQYPIYTAWINAKIIALLIYIILGTIALKRGKTKIIRVFSWCLAILVFAYIVFVANTKQLLFF